MASMMAIVMVKSRVNLKDVSLDVKKRMNLAVKLDFILDALILGLNWPLDILTRSTQGKFMRVGDKH